MRKFSVIILFLIVFLTASNFIIGQTKKGKTVKKSTKQTVKTTPTPTTTTSTEETPAKTATKKNERPTTEAPKNSLPSPINPVYFYEFAQPNFLVTKIFIEHDELGAGKITFKKQDFEEAVSDPIQLSPLTLEKIKTAFQTLNFLDSTENYQDKERNYFHLGELKFKIKKDGRERSAGFNWTENKDAKMLADEYRKIAQQYVWIFDINVARQNQPLQAPGLIDLLDGYVRRNEISDAEQMIPFLTQLSNDERIPLIARNHAARIVKEIEKKAEKEKEDKK